MSAMAKICAKVIASRAAETNRTIVTLTALRTYLRQEWGEVQV